MFWERAYLISGVTISFFLVAAKAQAVEAELISSHREEASQLRSMLSQKEEDLHRTVQKYEQVIQVKTNLKLLKSIIVFFEKFVLLLPLYVHLNSKGLKKTFKWRLRVGGGKTCCTPNISAEVLLTYSQNREDEMGDRVWQVQKQLEELQTRFRDTSEVGASPTTTTPPPCHQTAATAQSCFCRLLGFVDKNVWKKWRWWPSFHSGLLKKH